ncbi:MAG: NAD(P)H-dependent glycerol-3-phosphate dehydrogenase [Candidatus Omnitrophota bacterium]
MKHRCKITVMGDGGWGTTLALLLNGNGQDVCLWGAFADYTNQIIKKRENFKFLPGFKIPETIRLVSGSPEVGCEAADIVVLAVPAQYLRGVLRQVNPKQIRGKVVVTVVKGIEMRTLKVMSEVIHQEWGPVTLCALSGPNIAREIAMEMPAAASIASSNKSARALVRKAFTTRQFCLFESADVMGVELGGALKNVIAICAGILEGLGLGSNARAVLFARGVAEMARLGMRMGAHRETFMGLSGLGDLATTCLSPHSRNRWLGEEIGKGKTLKQILKETPMIVEGVATAKAAYGLARRYRVAMPIVESVYSILFHDKNPRLAANALMHREFTSELD